MYREKSDQQLAWLDARDRINQEVRLLARRLANTVLAEFAREQEYALQNGQIIELDDIDREEIKARLLRVSQKQLAPKAD